VGPLSQDLNFNVMCARRAEPVHSLADMDAAMRRGNAMRSMGSTRRSSPARRSPSGFPISIAARRAPDPRRAAAAARRTARHDAVAWGYACGADARGIDIIQQCEVTGSDRQRRGGRR
jgi:sarcosine oxidase subunit beta